jgi:hypothetical protein
VAALEICFLERATINIRLSITVKILLKLICAKGLSCARIGQITVKISLKLIQEFLRKSYGLIVADKRISYSA